ncbi:MAG: serine hydrolase [Planctomycetota bacterium]|nr:serine hydrolase [Planctomycetota bacterium]
MRWILISGLCLTSGNAHAQGVIWYDAGDKNPFTFSLLPSGKPMPLRESNGKEIRPNQIQSLYGKPGGLRILDGGIDIASQAWAEARNFSRAREVIYQNLSNRAGWPDIKVSSGTIALDPTAGRLKFSEGDTQQPLELVHSVPLPTGEPVGVAVKGRYAYFVSKNGHQTFQVLDLKNPSYPSLVAYMVAGDVLSQPQIQGDYLALSAGREGFKLLNISKPHRPEIVWEFHPRGDLTLASRAIFCGSVMYVEIIALAKPPTDLSDVGWHVFDVSEIEKPRKLGFLANVDPLKPPKKQTASPNEVIPTFFQGGVAYRTEDKNLHVLDLSDPVRPVVSKTYNLPEPVVGMSADGYLLYAFLKSGKIATIFHGRHSQKLLSINALAGAYAYSMAIQGDLLVAGASGGNGKSGEIRIYRMKDSATFELLATLEPHRMSPDRIVIQGDLVTVVDMHSGLWTLDLKLILKQAASASNHKIRLVVDEPGEVSKANAGLWFSRELDHRKLYLSGEKGLLSSSLGNFAQIDNSRPEAPEVSGIWRTGATFHLPVQEHLVLRRNQERHYRTFNLANPRVPEEVSLLDEPANSTPILVGDYIYLFTDSKEKDKTTTSLTIYDYHEPSFPYRVQAGKPLSEGFFGPFVTSLVHLDRLFIVRKGSLLQADISDPMRPRFTGQLEDSTILGSPSVTIRGNFLYMANAGHDRERMPELLIFDVKGNTPVKAAHVYLNTGGPFELLHSDHPGGGYMGDWRVEGDFLYGTGYWGGIRIYDISTDPLKPKLLDNEHAAFEKRFQEWDAAKRETGFSLLGRDETGTSIGALYRDHLIVPKRAAVNSYRVRRSPEIPGGQLRLESTSGEERFENAIAHVRGGMLALDEASAGAMIVRHKGKALVEWYGGRHTHDPNSRSVDADSRFPIWSLTKTFAVTGLGLLLDRGIVKLNDSVQRYIPEFKGKGKELVTFRHLATHTSGLPGDGDWQKDDLVYAPDERKGYSNCGMDLLAYSVGKLMGEAGFGQMMEKYVFDPLGMKQSGFLLPEGDTSLLIPALTTRDSKPWYDEWGPAGRGMAGLYMTARDLATYGEMYLREGTLYGRQILQASTVRIMMTPQGRGKAAEHCPFQGLGWHLKGSWKFDEFPAITPDGSYAHGGGTHCLLFVCPALDLVAVKLLNRGYWPGTFDYAGDYRRFIQFVLEAVERD